MKKIKLFDPFFDGREITAVQNAIKSKFWASGSGSGLVTKFESDFKKYIGSKSMIAVNSGTSALHLAVSILGIKGLEVLVPAMTFVSTANTVLSNNCKIKFVDIDEETLCIDTTDLEKKISKKTRAIIPVHFGGLSCNMKEIAKIAKENNLHVIEDAAHACGTVYRGKKIGQDSEIACFSFHPVKNLAMPTGGALSLNSTKYEKVLKSLRWCGISDRHKGLYDVKDLGWNFYMNEVSAAIGIEQLSKLDFMNHKRFTIAEKYRRSIDLEHQIPLDKNCAYHLYWIRTKNRSYFRKKMNESGIETGIHYKPVNLMSLYKTNQKTPITDSVWKELVSIPMHPNLSPDDVDQVIAAVNEFAR